MNELPKIDVECFLNRKTAREVLGESFVATEQQLSNLAAYFITNPYKGSNDNTIRRLAFICKAGFHDFDLRMRECSKYSKNSKSSFVALMGVDQGTRHFDSINNRRKETIRSIARTGGQSSKAARQLFREIEQSLQHAYSCIYDDGARKEWRCKDAVTGKTFAYDFKIRDHKVIIEYNGEHVHPRKELMTASHWKNWKCYWTGVNAQTAYDRDEYKNNFVRAQGFKLLVLWHADGHGANFNRAQEFLKKSLGNHTYSPKQEIKRRIYTLIHPNGQRELCFNWKARRLELGFSEHYAGLMLNGKIDSHQGYRILCGNHIQESADE